MSLSRHNFLAVAVGTKRVGTVVFGGTELLYFAVKTLKPPRTRYRVRQQVSQIVKTTFREFKPKLLIMRSLSKQQANSEILQTAVKQIKKEAEAVNIPLAEVSFEQVKAILSPGQKPTKASAFKTLSEAFPELKRFIEYNNPSQAEYYNSLLSAAAIGFAYQSKIIKSTSKPN